MRLFCGIVLGGYFFLIFFIVAGVLGIIWKLEDSFAFNAAIAAGATGFIFGLIGKFNKEKE